MILLTAERMRAADAACAQAGISTLTLMEKAGEQVAHVAASMLPGAESASIVVICGKGNNGGDGLAAAAALYAAGHRVTAALLAEPGSLAGDPATVLATLKADHVPLCILPGGEGLADLLSGLRRPALLIDALFGTGFRPPAAAPWNAVIETINAAGVPVLAVDLPSGLDADSGQMSGPAVRATRTVTFGAPKAAHFIHPAAAAAGKVMVAAIGHPPGIIRDGHPSSLLLEAGWCRAALPARDAASHKGSYGHLLVVAGSERMPGAALLAALGALRGGVGLVTFAVPGEVARAVPAFVPEAMPLALAADQDGYFSPDAAPPLAALAASQSAIVVGPGLGTGTGPRAVVEELLHTDLPTLLDADALNILALEPRLLLERRGTTVLTPHPGELGRLLGRPTAEIVARRLESAREAALRFGATVVLKGAGTIVATPEGGIMVNVTGNPGMATGGMGDVLAGLIGAFLAQGLLAPGAAALGVYLHGLAGDFVRETTGPWGLLAREVAAAVPPAFAAVIAGREDIEFLA